MIPAGGCLELLVGVEEDDDLGRLREQLLGDAHHQAGRTREHEALTVIHGSHHVGCARNPGLLVLFSGGPAVA